MAVLACFVLLGVTEGMWVARIPGVKAGLHLTDGLLGASLLVGPAGLVAVMPLAGRLADQFGSARLRRPAAIAVAILPVFLWTAGTLPAVLAAVLAFGVAGGLLAVGLNAQGVEVEQAYGRPLMASFHAAYSMGGLAGALLGGLLAWRQAAPAGHPQTGALAGIVLAGVAVAIIAGLWLPPDPGRRGRRPLARDRRPGAQPGRLGLRARPRGPAWPAPGARPAGLGRPSGPGWSRLGPADRTRPAGPVLPDRRGGGGQLERGLPPERPGSPARVRGRRICGFLPGHGGRSAGR